jgi:Uma2 family endonuclease
MTIATQTVPPILADRVYRLSTSQYVAMTAAGILGSEDRVELLEGLIIHKRRKSQPHILSTELISGHFAGRLPDGWYCSMQNPIEIAESSSVPEPDAKIVRGNPRDYAQRHVGPFDVALVIEVADASLPEDRGLKRRLYARAAIPHYWIVNLVEHRLEVYSDPTGPDPNPDYRRGTEHGPGDLVPLVLDGQEVAQVAVADLMP